MGLMTISRPSGGACCGGFGVNENGRAECYDCEPNKGRDTFSDLLFQNGVIATEFAMPNGAAYRVVFSERCKGPELVQCVYRRARDTGRVYRDLWEWRSGKTQSAKIMRVVGEARRNVLARRSP